MTSSRSCLARVGEGCTPPILALCAGIVVVVAVACGGGDGSRATTAQAGGGGVGGPAASSVQRTITDDGGREVSVPVQVEKVFCTSPVGTYLVYTLAPDKLVGWNTTPTELEQEYMPEEYHPAVGLGGWYGKNTTGNVEEIIKRGPGLILSVGDVTEGTVSDADRVQGLLNIPVVLVDSALAKTGEAYRFIGDLIGEKERAEQLAEYCDAVIARAQEIAGRIPDGERVTVYYAEGAKGLYTDPEGSTHTEVFTLVGARNVAEVELQQGYGMSPVSLEQVILWDPEFIFVASDPAGEMDVHGRITTGGDWDTVQAVADGHVYQIPHGPFDWLDRPYSIARIMGIQWVGDLLYPDLWELDLEDRTKEFYELFYHYQLGDAQYLVLMEHALATGQ